MLSAVLFVDDDASGEEDASDVFAVPDVPDEADEADASDEIDEPASPALLLLPQAVINESVINAANTSAITFFVVFVFVFIFVFAGAITFFKMYTPL